MANKASIAFFVYFVSLGAENHTIQFERYASAGELAPSAQNLLQAARAATANAYAPYSKFHVAAATYVAGKIVTATNQENASFPVGLCAERTLLSVLATQYAGEKIEAIALSFYNHRDEAASDFAISPCGLCRQTLLEFEQRNGGTIQLFMSGQQGEVIVLSSMADLLPFSFTSTQLK